MHASIGFWLSSEETQLSVCALPMRRAVNSWDLNAQILMQFIQNIVECRDIEGAPCPGDTGITYFYRDYFRIY